MRTNTRRLAQFTIMLVLSLNVFLSTVVSAQDPAADFNKGSIVRPKDGDLQLLQPIDDGQSTLTASPGLGPFFDYFNRAWPWVIGIGAGAGVLWALIGGIEIMISGSDTGRRESGKSRFMWALIGLLMVGLAGLILRTLNPLFYT